MGKPSVSQRAQVTEYEDKFVPPCCNKALITSSNKIHTYHQLKGTRSIEMTTLRSFWVRKPQKKQIPQLPAASKDQSRDGSPKPNHVRFTENRKASKGEDYTSTYTNDFRVGKADMRQPFRPHGNFNVEQGLVVASNGECPENSVPDAANSRQVQKPVPFESVTSYMSDYVVHPVQPRVRRNKPRRQSKQTPPAASMLAWDKNQDLYEGASEFHQQFKTWTLKTKLHDEAKAKESSPPADHKEPIGKESPTICAPKCTPTKPQSPAEKAELSHHQPICMRTEESRTYWAACGSPAACCLAEAKAS